MLYHLVVGSRPPRPDRLDEHLSRIPQRWRDVIRSGLALNPADRFASIEGWQAAVQDILAAEAAELTIKHNCDDRQLSGDAGLIRLPLQGTWLLPAGGHRTGSLGVKR